MAHITGGGITDNLPRILPSGAAARIDRATWEVPAVFRWLTDAGRVAPADAYRTFNMGIGLILAVAPADADAVLARLHAAGEDGAAVIGAVTGGDGVVEYV
jgi:phosphoribosylformylglycinamidine cyclo-ligase